MSEARARFESHSLVLIALVGYALTFLIGTLGSLLAQNSYAQLLFFQMADACGITASVIAARYTGLRSQQVAASAFILMGITHGISLAASGIETLNSEKSITLIMPMIPAMVLMLWCELFPAWLRYLGLVPAALFVYVYIRVLAGQPYFDWPTSVAYLLWNLVEVAWAIFLLRDYATRART